MNQLVIAADPFPWLGVDKNFRPILIAMLWIKHVSGRYLCKYGTVKINVWAFNYANEYIQYNLHLSVKCIFVLLKFYYMILTSELKT